MKLFKRENYLSKIRGFYHTDDLIKVITGVRRCGKSSIMHSIVEELLVTINEENIIFLDLDSRAYRKIKTADELDNLIYNKTKDIKGIKYIFIDEIQNVIGFEEVINSFRNEGNYSIFITGSNSYLLSGELATKLTGRYIEFEIYTLTFNEYLDMKEFYGKPISANLQEELSKYILEGGFPRSINFESLNDKRVYTENVIKEIFEKDIKRRIKIKDVHNFEVVKNFVINNFSSQMSINNIVEALVKGGNKITKATVSRYIQILLDAKIIYACKRFDMKSKKSLAGDKKYYLADLSFYYALNTDNQYNYGPCLENIVYIYARSLNYSISVGRIGKLECDFILRDNELNYSYVQVAYTIFASKETLEREYRTLELIRDNYKKYILTTDFLLQKRNGIIHVNVIDFMKNNSRF